jgi:hypothetical protein
MKALLTGLCEPKIRARVYEQEMQVMVARMLEKETQVVLTRVFEPGVHIVLVRACEQQK